MAIADPLTSVIMCFSPVLLASLAEEEMKVSSLLEGQKDVLLERIRQRRGVVSTINQKEVIELMVYVDKLMYDRYQQNRAALEQHILAILNLVCAYMCMHMLVCTSHCKSICMHCARGNVLMYTYARCVLMCVCVGCIGGCMCACACMCA